MNMVGSRTFAVVAGVAVAVLCGMPATAQNINASVSGSVVDEQGGTVSGAAVTIRNAATEIEHRTISDEQGRYQQPGLAPGGYHAEVKKDGFAIYQSSEFQLGLGDSYRLDPELRVGEFTTTVEVTAESLSVLQVDDTKQSRNFNAAEMNELPNAANGFSGRNFYVQALTTPGVTFSELAHRPFAVSGQRPRNNNYMIDSVQVNDVETGYIAGRGKTEQIVSQEAVQGMEVITHNYKAEYGRNSGSIVSLVSRSGSNDFHGSGYWYHINSATRARNFFEVDKAKSRVNLPGLTLGGPITRNKAFFFGNFETNKERGEDVSTFRTLLPQERARAVASVRPLVDLFPESPTGARVFAQGVPSPSDQYTYMFRADFSLTDKQTFMVRNNFTDNKSTLENLSGFVGHKVRTKRRTQSFTAHHTYAASPTVLNELRAGYMRFTQFDDFIDPIAIGDPSVNGEIGFMIVPGLSNAGSIGFMGKLQALNVYSLSDDLSWSRGAHTLKFGSALRRNHVNGGNPNNSFVGTIFFPNINAFLGGQPLSYSRNIGNPLIGLQRWEWDAYVQDDWRITSNLTFNLGLRYEFYSSPGEQFDRISDQFRFATDKNNVAPRIGLAWKAADKTVVRAGWGIYYNALEMSFIGLTRFNPPNISTLTAFRPQLPNLLAGAQQAIPSGLVIPADDTRTPYAQHFNFSIERELWNPRSTLTAAYVGTTGTKLARTRRPNGGDNLAQDERPDPTVGVVNRLETSGVSNYHSLQLGLNQRFSDFTFKAAYTYSRFLDDVSELADGNTRLDRGILPIDESNLNLDRGLSDFHIPHIFSFSYIYRLPWMSNNRWLGGWSFSGITAMQSGRPFTLYSGTNNLTGTDNNRIYDIAGMLSREAASVRPIQIQGGLDTAAALEPVAGQLGTLSRNTERGDTLLNWNIGLIKDFAVSERFKVQFRAEAFNLFNTTNFNEADGVLSIQRDRQSGRPIGFNPNFGSYIDAFNPRSAQFTLRVVF